jgi:4'-phosphopantetheinyl transferase
VTRVVQHEPHPAARAPCTGLQVWRVRLDRSPGVLEASSRILDDAERQRAARFRTAADRARYVLARASLRRLLASELGVPSERLAFGANAFGKPVLTAPDGSLHFNSSHSGDWIVHASDALGPVGIDIEAVRPELGNVEDFAAALCPEERLRIARLPARDRPLALARTWVRKEAYVKAIGEGLTRSPARINVGTDETGKPCLLYDRNGPSGPQRWTFHDIAVGEHHVACLVYSRGDDAAPAGRAVVIRDFF